VVLLRDPLVVPHPQVVDQGGSLAYGYEALLLFLLLLQLLPP